MYNELWCGKARAIVSIEGGYVTNLSDDNGDIFYPKRTLKAVDGSDKLRGGCHVCLPNFGPGGDSGLAQHGFGRTSEWNIIRSSETEIELELMRGEGEYSGLASRLIYTLAETSLMLVLVVKNNGDTPLRIAPAFHPYFATAGADDVLLDGERQVLDELNEAVFVSGDEYRLETPVHDMTLTSKGLPIWAKWTDRLGQYVCIEPSLAGNAFLSEASDNQLLIPGESRSYEFTVSWRP